MERNIAPDVRINQPGEGRLIVILLDDAAAGVDPVAIQTVRKVAERIVDELGPADQAAVVFTNDNRNAQDFTSDHERLVQAIGHFAGVPPGYSPLRDQYSMNALLGAVQVLSGLPQERAAIFLISTKIGGIGVEKPVPGSAIPANHDYFQDLGNALSRSLSHVPVYPICPSRVGGKTGCDADSLLTIAGLSGGRAVLNTSTPAAEVPSLFAELATTYTLGYRPTYAPGDGHLHWTHISIDRPGVTIEPQDRAQDAESVDATDGPKGTALTRALSSPVPKPDLPLRVSLSPFAVTGQRTTALRAAVTVTLGISLPVAPSDATRTQLVELETQVFDSEGRRAIQSQHQTARFVFHPGPADTFQGDLLSSIDLPPGRYNLRLAAHNATLNATGSIYSDVTVPDFARAAVSLSGVVVGLEPRPVAAPEDALAKLVPIVPTTQRTFDTSDRVRTFVRVYEGGGKPLLPLTFSTRIVNERDEAVLDRTEAITTDRLGTGRAADELVDVPVANLPPGGYLLTFEATLGRATARRDVRFNVR